LPSEPRVSCIFTTPSIEIPGRQTLERLQHSLEVHLLPADTFGTLVPLARRLQVKGQQVLLGRKKRDIVL